MNFAFLTRAARYIRVMNEQNWMHEIHRQDTKHPAVNVAHEPVYTVYLKDFLRMPDVNFVELATVDVAIRALMN
jgi:hypothetical protein